MKESEYTFAFFPYLKTSEPLSYRGLTIRSSVDPGKLPSDAIRHLESLRSIFFLRDHLRIQEMSYAFHSSTEKDSVTEFTYQILEFRALVCFIYSAPHPISGDPFLTYEHASLYLLQPKQVSKYLLVSDSNVEILPEAQSLEFDSRSEREGYECRLNDESYFWVTQSSRIFPPAARLWLNTSQDLSADFDYRLSQSKRYGSVIEYFATKREDDILSERILTALTWYNRSIGIDIAESLALVNLAIAFESLLDLEAGEKITERFEEAVNLLVGGVPRLDSWLKQFYKARSQIVHKGRSASLMFVATDDLKKPYERPELEYRSLVSYGRQIFQVCVASILTGTQIAAKLKLASLLVTNQQRLERICQTLSKGKGSPADRIVAVSQDVYDIETYRFVAERGLTVRQLVGTAKLIIQQYLDSAPDESSKLLTHMKEFCRVKPDDYYEELLFLKEIQEDFKTENFAQPPTPLGPRSIVASLIDSIWHYTFVSYFQLERQQKQKEIDAAAQQLAEADQLPRRDLGAQVGKAESP